MRKERAIKGACAAGHDGKLVMQGNGKHRCLGCIRETHFFLVYQDACGTYGGSFNHVASALGHGSAWDSSGSAAAKTRPGARRVAFDQVRAATSHATGVTKLRPDAVVLLLSAQDAAALTNLRLCGRDWFRNNGKLAFSQARMLLVWVSNTSEDVYEYVRHEAI